MKGSCSKAQMHLREANLGWGHTSGLVIVGTIVTAGLRALGGTVMGSQRQLELQLKERDIPTELW